MTNECYICHEGKDITCTLKCDFPKCKKYFHVVCAIKEETIYDLEEMEKTRKGECIPLFCKRHLKQGTKEFTCSPEMIEENESKEFKQNNL